MLYNVRTGQSQVTEKAVAELARANAFSVVWRAKRPQERLPFLRFCP